MANSQYKFENFNYAEIDEFVNNMPKDVERSELLNLIQELNERYQFCRNGMLLGHDRDL